MANHEALTLSVLKRIKITGTSSFYWNGQPSGALPLNIRRKLSSEHLKSHLTATLRLRLYRDVYCRGEVLSAVGDEYASDARSDPIFVQSLSDANVARGYWQNGWHKIRKLSDQRILASNGYLTCQVKTDDWKVGAGDELMVKVATEWRGVSPGFFMVQGGTQLPNHAVDIVRVYLNANASHAKNLMRYVTQALMDSNIAYKFKMVDNPKRYSRCDAAVLYVDLDNLEEALIALRPDSQSLQEMLEPGVPAFTMKIAPGFAIAEDPNDGESFGLSRCTALATGSIDAYERGVTTLDEKLQCVREAFRTAGCELDTAFASNNVQRLQTLGATFAAENRNSSSPAQHLLQTKGNDSNPSVLDPLDAAVAIGQEISQRAIWNGDRCTWIGATPGQTPVHRTLGFDIDSGTAGIALFLCELYQATNYQPFERCARAAINQSFWGDSQAEPEYRHGLLTGAVGVAMVAARMGQLLDDDSLIRKAQDIVESFTRVSDKGPPYDYMAGYSGAALGMLALSPLCGAPAWDLAECFGKIVISAAELDDRGASWSTEGGRAIRNLTGFSHGASGIAFALLKLDEMLRMPDAKETALAGISYETTWLDTNTGNWPDFRGKPSRYYSESNRPHGISWCHGAPGIGLARIEILKSLKSVALEREAECAMSTTLRITRDWLQSGGGNFCLCHGLCGNIEILQAGNDYLSTSDRKLRDDIVTQVVRSCNEFAATVDWPCGVPGGTTPGLMTGWAGIGRFLLAQCGSQIPSVIALDPTRWLMTQSN